MSNNHTLDPCHHLNQKFFIKTQVRNQNQVKKLPEQAPGEQNGDDDSDTSYESDTGFTPADHDSDPDMLATFHQQAKLAVGSTQVTAYQAKDDASTAKTSARIGTKAAQRWIKPTYAAAASTKVKWKDAEQLDLAKLAKSNHYYLPTSRILCPDSGATSIMMCPHRDIFIDYVDLGDQGRVFRLGEDNKTIPILGRGTMRLNIQGHTIALANTLYVPDLSAILLSSRIFRHISPGCAFIADHDGCFLTFPEVTFEINDDSDCTLLCQTVPPTTATFDFDSRLHLFDHSSNKERQHRNALRATYMQKARLAGIRKSQAHLDPTNLRSPDGLLPWSDSSDHATMEAHPQIGKDKVPANSPIQPVYLVPNSATKAAERMSSYDLKRMFGCRSLNDWRMLETGTGLHVMHEGSPPLTIGDMATINRNKHGKLLDRPTTALHTVGMDIGYGGGTSPGGYKYALTLVDFANRHTWVYGLGTKTAGCITDALWCFCIDAGNFPTRIRCNFDSSFIKGKVYSFLRRKGIRVGASPPNRQSQNGAVERQWRTATSMAHALLVEAKLP